MLLQQTLHHGGQPGGSGGGRVGRSQMLVELAQPDRAICGSSSGGGGGAGAGATAISPILLDQVALVFNFPQHLEIQNQQSEHLDQVAPSIG